MWATHSGYIVVCLKSKKKSNKIRQSSGKRSGILIKLADTHTHAYLWTHGRFNFDWKETFCFNHVRHTRSYKHQISPSDFKILSTATSEARFTYSLTPFHILLNSLIIHDENTKKNHNCVVSNLYVIEISLDLHKFKFDFLDFHNVFLKITSPTNLLDRSFFISASCSYFK
jgi:hypothetical protein